MVNKYNSKDYLPQEVNDEWFETDFQQAKYKAGSDKMINTERYVVGVNTVGQSLKILPMIFVELFLTQNTLDHHGITQLMKLITI